VQVTASDWDEGDNGLVYYSIPGNVGELFHIDQHGIISVHVAVDREAYDTFRFPVLAEDGGSPALTGSALVVISIEDVDDERPQFVQREFHFNVVENEVPAGSQIGFVQAEDRDGAPYNAFVYAFHSGDEISEAAFSVDSGTGAVTMRHALDRESRPRHHFVVVAYDAKSPASSGTAAVVVDVEDRNDHAPQFGETGNGNDSVALQLSSRAPPGHVITSLSASDDDDGVNAQLTYSLSADESSYDDITRLFRVDARRGTVSVNSALPTSGLFRLLIVAVDGGTPPLSASTVLTVCVNKSVPFQPSSSAASTSPYGDSGSMSLSSTSAFNLVLLVAVVCGCAVVVFVLVVVIALVRHRDRRHHARKYNCRMEALRVITSGGADAPEVASGPSSSAAAKSTSLSTNSLHNGLRTTTTFPVHEVNKLYNHCKILL